MTVCIIGFLVLASLQCIAYGLLQSNSTEQLFASSCGSQLSAMSEDDVLTLERLAPPHSFMHHLNKHMKHRKVRTVLLLEVDLTTHSLALNHIECLRMTNSTVVPFIVAYEAGVCEKMTMHVSGGCYFDEEWSRRLVTFYNSVPNADKHFNHGYRAMLGRMMTTIFTLCGGYNLFLSDSDIVYYRDPMAHVLHDVDMMLTSTFISGNSNSVWGGFFYATRPGEYSTMNNGVVLFKSTEVIRNLHLTMATEGIKSFLAEGDPSFGFLQVIFNKQMVKHKLSVYPCSAVSDPHTKKFDATHPLLGGNKAGECYDCYHGTLNWTSNVVLTPEKGPTVLPLTVGVFPMERYVSHCAFEDVQVLKKVTATAAAALKSGSLTGWGWGEDMPAAATVRRLSEHATTLAVRSTNNSRAVDALSAHQTRRLDLLEAKTRSLSAHANCIHGTYAGERFSNKEWLLKEINSWYL